MALVAVFIRHGHMDTAMDILTMVDGMIHSGQTTGDRTGHTHMDTVDLIGVLGLDLDTDTADITILTTIHTIIIGIHSITITATMIMSPIIEAEEIPLLATAMITIAEVPTPEG